MKVSVALCTYYGEAFLQDQLDSLLRQSRLPEQIVVYDDCSGDRTWEMLRAFEKAATALGIEVLLVRQVANVGYVRNFEAALARCTGDLVFLCDQDDIWHRGKVESIAALFDANPHLCLVHGEARLVDAIGEILPGSLLAAFDVGEKEREALLQGRGFDLLLVRNIATGATMAIRREVVAEALPIPDSWGHDEWLAMVAVLMGDARCLTEPTIDYRQHGRNQIGARAQGWWGRATDRSVQGGYMAGMVRRLEAFVHRSAEMPWLKEEQRETLRQRLAHARFRASQSRQWWRRIIPVMIELARGRYHRYSAGWRSVVSDLVGMEK